MIRIIDIGRIQYLYEQRWTTSSHRFVGDKCLHVNAMSSIRKSASFRSRIPVRRAKPLPRRYYSPPPLSTVSSATEYRSSNTNKSRDTTVETSNKHKQKHPIWLPQQLSTSASGPTMATKNTTTTAYSSSSYSSSDESQESEAPLQVNIIIFIIIMNWCRLDAGILDIASICIEHRLCVSTDATKID